MCEGLTEDVGLMLRCHGYLSDTFMRCAVEYLWIYYVRIYARDLITLKPLVHGMDMVKAIYTLAASAPFRSDDFAAC